MGELQRLARAIGADERTLRRAVGVGLVRCQRIGARRLRLEKGEQEYLAGHWELLAQIRSALRTEPNVRLAVVYGSVARGDDRPDSDIDLLVSLAEDKADAAVRLAVHLERAVGRKVDIARLNRVEERSPLLLLRALEEGRVVLDRDAQWPGLVARRQAVAQRARRAHAARRRRAGSAVRELVGARWNS